MHIVLIHQSFASPDEPGGTRHYELARHVVEAGHAVTIVASDLNYLAGRRTVERKGMVDEQTLDGVRVLRVYTYPSLHLGFAGRVFSYLSYMVTSVIAALRAGPADLVMGTSPPIFQALSAWLVAAIRRRPFLLEIRDLWPEFAIGMGVLRNPILIRLSRGLEAFLYRRAGHLLVNSPAYRDYLLQKGIAPEKISLIANGVDPQMFSAVTDGSSLRQEWGVDGCFVVVYAGALGVANDLTTLVRAAARLRDHPEIRFVVVGDGRERGKLETLAQQLQLSNVTFAGAYPKAEMPRVLAAADACIAILKDIPMFRTTYPNKVFDYMAAGRPTVLSIDGVIRAVIEASGGGVFVPPGDDDALARAVATLARSGATPAAMGQAARTYVTRHFNRHDQARAFLTLLERLQPAE